MQELFVDKIYFFKFLCTSDKAWLDQLKTTVLLLMERFNSIGARKEKYPVLRTNIKTQQLIEHTKMSFSIAPFVFCKFSCVAYHNGLN